MDESAIMHTVEEHTNLLSYNSRVSKQKFESKILKKRYFLKKFQIRFNIPILTSDPGVVSHTGCYLAF